MNTCEGTPPRRLLRAVGEFNRREWFECHETLEGLWIGEVGTKRDLYQGILQVAVALHHWRNGNYGGAVRLLEGGAGYLRRVEPACLGVDVAGLIVGADRVRTALTELGRERMADLPEEMIPTLRLVQIAEAD